MTAPSIAVVVRTFNEEAHIGRLLAGIGEQDRPAEVVVVDSGSTDSTVLIASQFDGVTVERIEPESFSFGRALNRGIAACDADIAVMSSAHVYPLRSSWLSELAAPFENPEVVIAYGRQVGDDRTRFSEEQLFRKWFPEASHVSKTSPFCNNANAAVRTSWWREHPYDEDLTGLEDVAAGQEAIRAERSIAYVAEAPVAHIHEEEFGRLLNRYRREAIALNHVFPSSQMSAPVALGLFATNAGSDAYAALRRGRFGAMPDVVRFRFAQFLGGYLGHRQSESVPAELRRRLYYPRRFWRRQESVAHTGREIDYGADHPHADQRTDA